MGFVLNRLSMTGPVNEDTPFDVIKSLALHCGIKVSDSQLRRKLDYVIENINNFEAIEIDCGNLHSLGRSELQEISLYVSCVEEAWDRRTLLDSFIDLLNFINEPKLPSRSYTVASRTRKNPYSIDILMLYRLCKDLCIETKRDYTITDLSRLVKMENKSRDTINSEIISRLSRMSKGELISLLTRIEPKEKGEYVFNEKSVEKLKKLNITMKQFMGRTFFSEEEAIYYASVYYNIDISESSCPNAELVELNNCKKRHKILDKYVPILNDKFKSNYLLNKDFYNVTKYWKPHLESIYGSKQLTVAAKNNFVEFFDEEQAKVDLQAKQLTKSFYQGIIPNCNYSETFILLTPFSDLRQNEIISYGILADKRMIALTPDEITSHFDVRMSFSDFEFESEMISPENIETLKYFCYLHPNDDNYDILLNKIMFVENQMKLNDSHTIKYIEMWRNGSEALKERIDKVNRLIMELGMYMRGWKILKEDFPLSETDCNDADNADLEGKIDINVNDAAERLSTELRCFDIDHRTIIMNLPLIKYNDKNGTFYKSSREDEGLTVFDRIDIVLNKNNAEIVYACRRLSSNHIAASAYHYHSLLHREELFPLSKFKVVL